MCYCVVGMNMWNTLADKQTAEKTIAALKANGMDALIVETGREAKEKVLSLIPEGSEVMNMTSRTLEQIGVAQEMQQSGKYNSVRNLLMKIDRAKQGKEMKRLEAAPDYTVGSVHAVTQDGKVLVASNTGSQFPAYAYASPHIIWVIGTQKIVKNLEEGLKRMEEHSLPLESERAKKAYGVAGSNIGKILIVNKEVIPGRITIIFVNEKLGF